ncbi:Lon protease [Photobacterium sanctipauli]|uniref:Lon protease n=1 Tax=Photobacterium sanctipauli TaxID=1342794 RepID=A0A2T3NNL5_9GAMM|nr:LON peptidase substrate-binding domain-containing protein [Photobacterium sanctipauli]PSW17280.1 Lon protease [Photobacterium sanctipauli]
MTDIALYPSSQHILPGGRVDITITEERYQRMLKESLSDKRHFAVCMLNEAESDQELKTIPAIATLCRVVNFDMQTNGLLMITVEGSHKVRLLGVSIEYDGLFRGEYTDFSNWPPLPIDEKDADLAEKLAIFFETMPEIGEMYQKPDMEDVSWVCQRWIEVLPLEVHYKQLLITQETPKLTIRFLHKLFQ